MSTDCPDVTSTNPLRSYLREIGCVPLLFEMKHVTSLSRLVQSIGLQ